MEKELIDFDFVDFDRLSDEEAQDALLQISRELNEKIAAMTHAATRHVYCVEHQWDKNSRIERKYYAYFFDALMEFKSVKNGRPFFAKLYDLIDMCTNF